MTKEGVERPVAFCARTLKTVGLIGATGVPLITQVVALIVKPLGRPGSIKQAVMTAPLFTRADGVTLIGTPTEPLVPVAPAKLKLGIPAVTTRLILAGVLVPTEFSAVIL